MKKLIVILIALVLGLMIFSRDNSVGAGLSPEHKPYKIEKSQALRSEISIVTYQSATNTASISVPKNKVVSYEADYIGQGVCLEAMNSSGAWVKLQAGANGFENGVGRCE